MKGLKKGLAMLLVLVACLALTTMAFAAEYTVRPRQQHPRISDPER